MSRTQGRPHWGKVSWADSHDLAKQYPHWNDFQVVRQRLDPVGMFSNAYLDARLGSVRDEHVATPLPRRFGGPVRLSGGMEQ